MIAAAQGTGVRNGLGLRRVLQLGAGECQPLALLQRHGLADGGAGKGALSLGGKLEEKIIKITANYYSWAVDPGPTAE